VGRTFQLVDDVRISQREYIEDCAQRSPGNLRVMYVPRPVFYLAAIGIGALGAMLKRSVPLTRYKVASICGVKEFDCSPAREVLAWRACSGREARIWSAARRGEGGADGRQIREYWA